jgi:hypothetical protein
MTIFKLGWPAGLWHAALVGVCWMASHDASASGGLVAPPLQGVWGTGMEGERLLFTATPEGGRIEMGCATGSLLGPIHPGGDGKFQAVGTFDKPTAGPQMANKSTAPNARFVGELQDGVLTLSILPDGATAPQVFKLHQGVRVKLFRCL